MARDYINTCVYAIAVGLLTLREKTKAQIDSNAEIDELLNILREPLKDSEHDSNTLQGGMSSHFIVLVFSIAYIA